MKTCPRLVLFFLAAISSFAFGEETKTPAKLTRLSTVVYAAWYRVPDDSLARRRAKANEFTAAHNELPLGTLVRVTNVANNKSAVVRITDRGITLRKCKIDICKEAAEHIGIVHQGIAPVRLQILPKKIPVSAFDEKRAAAAP